MVFLLTKGIFLPNFLNWCADWNGRDNELYSLWRVDIITAHALYDGLLSISFVVRRRWGHEAVEQSMGTTSAYLRSLRGIIPLIVSPGNAPAWLLIVSRKHNLKIKQEKWKDSRKINTFLIHFFFQSKLRITFNSVSSVKIYSHSESFLPPKWSCLVLFMWLRKEAGLVWLEDTSYFSGVVDSLGDRAVN